MEKYKDTIETRKYQDKFNFNLKIYIITLVLFMFIMASTFLSTTFGIVLCVIICVFNLIYGFKMLEYLIKLQKLFIEQLKKDSESFARWIIGLFIK